MSYFPYTFSQLAPPSPRLKLVVTIPAKNEEDYIIPTLEALLGQELEPEQHPENFEVIVLINHSYDRTLYRCKKFKEEHPEFALHLLTTYTDAIANVGAARRFLMDGAAKRLKKANYLITMTDADTCAGKNWIASLLPYVTKDIDMICGEIEVDYSGLSNTARQLFIAKENYLLYRSRLEAFLIPEKHDPWPRHAANSGPNMTIKKAAYQKIGGIPAVSCLEDMALHRLALHHNLKIKHALNIAVHTSSRLISRVEKGFGHELNFWSALNDPNYMYAVEGLLKLQTRLKAFQLVRKAFKNQDFSIATTIAALLKLPNQTILDLFNYRPNYQAMNLSLFTILEKHRPWQETHPNVSVFKANMEITQFFNDRPLLKSFPTALSHRLGEPESFFL